MPKKEDFYSNLNIEDVKDSDCNHAKRVCKDVKNFVSWLYLKSDTLLLANAFENFRKMCSEIYELVPQNFLSTKRLAWQAALKKTWVKSKPLTDTDMLLMAE